MRRRIEDRAAVYTHMIAYKLYRRDFSSFFTPGVPYAVGQEYSVEGPLRFRRNGFHAWQTLEDLVTQSPVTKNARLARVELSGEVITRDDGMALARRIKILEELDPAVLFPGQQQLKNSTTEVYLRDGRLHREGGPAHVRHAGDIRWELFCVDGRFLGAAAPSGRTVQGDRILSESWHETDSPWFGTPPIKTNDYY